MVEEIKKIRFGIKGIAPMKMDKWHGLPDPKTPEGYKKQAEEKCYRDDKGDLSIPATAIKASMRLASSELGKKMESKKNRQAISAGLFVKPVMLSLGKKKHDGIVEDVVTRKGTGDKVTRVVTYRPSIKDGWSVTGMFHIIGIPNNFVKQALELAGLKYGLLGHRPEFGRFVVTEFKEV